MTLFQIMEGFPDYAMVYGNLLDKIKDNHQKAMRSTDENAIKLFFGTPIPAQLPATSTVASLVNCSEANPLLVRYTEPQQTEGT